MEKNIVKAIKEEVANTKCRSAWDRGVRTYAIELVDSLAEAIEGGYFDTEDLAFPWLVERQLLNGASSWGAYSWGGCSLIYDRDIAERLCNPSELKKSRNGELKPNAREEWLDTQMRALYQAANLVRESISEVLDA